MGIKNDVRKKNFRFGLIKYCYGFSGAALAKLTNYGTGSAFNNLDAGVSRPSYSMVLAFQKVFCVSADWLLNHNVPPYQEQIVYDAEKSLVEQLVLSEAGNSFLNSLPLQYRDYTERRVNYTLEARANLVVLTYYTKSFYAPLMEEVLKNCTNNLTPYDILTNTTLLEKMCQKSNCSLSRKNRSILIDYAMLMVGKKKDAIYKLND